MSEKPEPMLRHFFGMLVDENTVMLDPTCGSGSALRAAESLGAKYVLGLESNEEFADRAREALAQFRTLRKADKASSG
jgi:DNA modification methylase